MTDFGDIWPTVSDRSDCVRLLGLFLFVPLAWFYYCNFVPSSPLLLPFAP